MLPTESTYNWEMADSCLNCTLRADHFFCGLSAVGLQSLAAISYPSIYPERAVLFVQGQSPRGVYVLCHGRAKLSMVSSEGRSLIMRVAEAGDMLGLSACILGQSYPVTVETLTPCQMNFVRRDDFLRLVRDNSEVTFRVAQFLSTEYQSACKEIGSLGLASSAAQKLARLLLRWNTHRNTNANSQYIRLNLTHEEMAQMIGASRETVARMLARFRRRDYIEVHGPTLIIRDRAALEALAGQNSSAQQQELVPVSALNQPAPSRKPSNGCAVLPPPALARIAIARTFKRSSSAGIFGADR